MLPRPILIACIVLASFLRIAFAQLDLPADAKELALSRGLAVEGVAQWARRPINIDGVVALVVAGKLGDPAWGIPRAGDAVPLPAALPRPEKKEGPTTAAAGEKPAPESTPAPAPGAWHDIAANDKGEFADAKPGTYILVHVRSATARVMILEAAGHAMVYENAMPRMGDPYATGYVRVPVWLREGDNLFLFAHAARGAMRAKLVAPAAEISINDADMTLPDMTSADAGDECDIDLGIPVINASHRERHVAVGCAGEGQDDEGFSMITSVPACSVVKVAAHAPCKPAPGAGAVKVRVRVFDTDVPGQATLDEKVVSVPVVKAGAPYKLTYTSVIDDSVQYVALREPAPDAPLPSRKGPGEGASAAPGPDPREDQAERERPGLVLSLHGASVEAINQAGSYAPHAGLLIACPTNRRPYGFDWEDWGRIDALEAMDFVREVFQTDPTRQYLTGHSMGGHGTWQLGVLYPERFAAIAPSAGWLSFDSYVGVGGPAHTPGGPLGPAFERARASSNTTAFFENLRGRGVFILHGDADDNVPVEQARAARKELDRLGIAYDAHEQPGAGHWWDDDKPGVACVDWPGIWATFAKHRLDPEKPHHAAAPRPLTDRGFVRGSFKRAFDRSFVLVTSTGGTDPENAWSVAKARFDAEQWWYRGNGQARVLRDDEFLALAREGAGLCNVILYGNADTNKAWERVLGRGVRPASRGELQLGGKKLTGEDLACLLVLPRADVSALDGEFEVGVVGGTGLPGMRATERLAYFSAGTGFPDLLVLRARVWLEGPAAIKVAGAEPLD